jgi:diguanylate cyclase (GGDEF)-like protein
MEPATVMPTAEIDSLLEQCRAARHGGAHQDGADFAEHAVNLAASFGDPHRQALALSMLALHRLRLDELQASIVAGEAALDLLSPADPLRSEVHSTLGLAYLNVGLTKQAIEHSTLALQAARKSQDKRAEIQALSRVGLTYEEAGEPNQSIEAGREAVALARVHGDAELKFMALHNLSVTLSGIARISDLPAADRQSMLQEAVDCERGANEHAHEAGNAHRMLVSIAALGDALVHLGQRDEAVTILQAALTWPVIQDLPRTRLLIEISLAHADRDIDVDRSIEAYCNLAKSSELHTNPTLEIKVRRSLHELCKAAGHYEMALENFERYVELKLAEIEQTAGLQARVLLNRLDVEQARHDADLANTRALEFERIADHDPLTGLHNRRALNHSVPNAILASHQTGQPLCFAVLDIDHFKSVNDTYGHGVGDRVIVTVAEIIASIDSSVRLAARIGGEEFLLVVDNHIDGTVELSERLRLRVAEHDWTPVVAGELAITVSVGVAQLNAAEEMRHILSRADDALFAAKRQGRNRVCTYDQVKSEPTRV